MLQNNSNRYTTSRMSPQNRPAPSTAPLVNAPEHSPSTKTVSTTILEIVLEYCLIREPKILPPGSGKDDFGLAYCSIGPFSKAFPHSISQNIPKSRNLKEAAEKVYQKANKWTFFANALFGFDANKFELPLCRSGVQLMRNVSIQFDFLGCIRGQPGIIDRSRVLLMRDNVIQICKVLSKAEHIPTIELAIWEMTKSDNDVLVSPEIWHDIM